MRKLGAVLLLILPLYTFSQTLDVTVGAGYTAVDVEGLVEKDEVSGTFARDWNQTSYGISAQYMFTKFGKIGFGGELMYQYLYWYQVSVPFGESRIIREYDVEVIRITPIFRFGGDNAFNFDLGPEINISDALWFGLLASANYYIPVNEKISIPIKLRLDVMFGTVIQVPISLNTGVQVKF